MEHRDVVLTSVFVAFEAAFSYSAFLPSIMTIGTFVDSPQKVVMIRQGEVVSTLLSLGVAVVVALIYKDPLPVFMMALAAITMIGVYEWALRGSPQLTGGVD